MQVYRFMDIGTAKPSLAERSEAPHHLFDIVTPDERYSAGQFAEEARAAAEAIHQRGRVVFLTGGTGLYIRAFLSGLISAGEVESAEVEERTIDKRKRARTSSRSRAGSASGSVVNSRRS